MWLNKLSHVLSDGFLLTIYGNSFYATTDVSVHSCTPRVHE